MIISRENISGDIHDCILEDIFPEREDDTDIREHYGKIYDYHRYDYE
jgi:hypothetical protein